MISMVLFYNQPSASDRHFGFFAIKGVVVGDLVVMVLFWPSLESKDSVEKFCGPGSVKLENSGSVFGVVSTGVFRWVVDSTAGTVTIAGVTGDLTTFFLDLILMAWNDPLRLPKKWRHFLGSSSPLPWASTSSETSSIVGFSSARTIMPFACGTPRTTLRARKNKISSHIRFPSPESAFGHVRKSA